MWIDYMAEVLEGLPEDAIAQPGRLTRVRIDKKTGEMAVGKHPNSMFELFRVEKAPRHLVSRDGSNRANARVGGASSSKRPRYTDDQLF
jgi:membrane carboxypeptidase/penicillin-binding protein